MYDSRQEIYRNVNMLIEQSQGFSKTIDYERPYIIIGDIVETGLQEDTKGRYV